MKKNKLNSVIDILVILIVNFCVIVFGIWVSAIPLTKSEKFYNRHFENNETAKTHLTSSWMFPDEDPLEIMEKVRDITIEYYFGNAEEYQVYVGKEDKALFNEDEVRHMKDVKELYVGGQIIAIISFILLVGGLFYLAFHFRRIRKKLLWVSISFYGIVIILIGAFFLWGYVSYKNDSLINQANNGYFPYAFVNFHKLLFPFDADKVALATGQNGYDIYTLTRILDSNLFMSAGIIIGIVLATVVIIWFSLIIVFYKLHPKLVKKVDEIHERARYTSESFHQS